MKINIFGAPRLPGGPGSWKWWILIEILIENCQFWSPEPPRRPRKPEMMNSYWNSYWKFTFLEPRGSQEAQEAENDEFLMKCLLKMLIFGTPSLPGGPGSWKWWILNEILNENWHFWSPEPPRRPRKPTLPGGPGKEREKEGEADKREGTTAGEEDNKEKKTLYIYKK